MGATSATSARSWRHSGCNVRKKEGMRKQEKKKKEERRKRAWRLGRSGFRSSAYNPCKIRGYSHPGRHPPAISLCLYLDTVHTHGLQFGVWSDTLEIAIQSLKKTKRKRKGKEKRKKKKKKRPRLLASPALAVTLLTTIFPSLSAATQYASYSEPFSQKRDSSGQQSVRLFL